MAKTDMEISGYEMMFEWTEMDRIGISSHVAKPAESVSICEELLISGQGRP